MSDTSKRDRGVAHVLLMRMENQRLPFALQLKKKVDRGERLSDFDTRFLAEIQKDSAEVKRAADKVPEYKELVQRMVDLYTEITRKALENEKNPASAPKPKAPDDL